MPEVFQTLLPDCSDASVAGLVQPSRAEATAFWPHICPWTVRPVSLCLQHTAALVLSNGLLNSIAELWSVEPLLAAK